MNGHDPHQVSSSNGKGVYVHMHIDGPHPSRAGRPWIAAPGQDGNGTGRREAIEIAIPARPDMLRVVRMSAGVIAARAELPYEDLDDLCLAVDELGVLVMGAHLDTGPDGHDPHGDEARLWVRFSWKPGDVTVQCTLARDGARALSARNGVGMHPAPAPKSGEPVGEAWRPSDDAAPLARLILEALVDDYGLGEQDGNPSGWLHKRRVGARG